MKKIKKTVNSYDVAKLAGVSQSAVSRAFAKNKSISEDKRQRIFKAAKKLNYRVNYTAQGLSSPRSRLVGLVMTHWDNSLRVQQVRLITESLLKNGYHPILLSFSDNESLETLLEDLLGYNLSGIIVTSGNVPKRIIDECKELDVPVVAMYHDTNMKGVDHVSFDLEYVPKLAFDMLYSCGVRKMATVKIKDTTYTTTKRTMGFVDMCREKDIPCHVFEINGRSYEYGKQLAHDIYRSIDQTDGIFAISDIIGMGIMDGLRQFGIRVPKDIQVLGFGDMSITNFETYKLSTIQLEVVQSAEKIIEMLIARIENPDLNHKIYHVNVTPIFRQTTHQN